MTTAIITPPAPSVPAAAAGFGLLLSPQSLKEVREFAEMLSKSDYVPKPFKDKPGDIMVAGAMGARLGVDVFAAMAGIAPINGKPSIYGDLMLAVCQNSPAFEDCLEEFIGTYPTDDFGARCTAKRKGKAPKVEVFTIADAKKAGLWTKQGPWSTTPKRMLQMRARAFALRDAFADVLAGFHAREEMEDGLKVVEAEVIPEATPAKRRVIKEPGPAPETQPTTEPSTTTETQATTAQAEAKPETTAPPLLTVADLVARAQAIAKEHGPRGLEAVKKFNDRIGVKRTGECPPEHVAKAFDILKAFERELVENGGAA
jgi:hypothetical protein